MTNETMIYFKVKQKPFNLMQHYPLLVLYEGHHKLNYITTRARVT